VSGVGSRVTSFGALAFERERVCGASGKKGEDKNCETIGRERDSDAKAE
jgi:hypothetical protein